MRRNDYGMPDTGGVAAICMGVSFNKYANGKYDYALRYNLTIRPGGGDRSDFPETESENRLYLHKR